MNKKALTKYRDKLEALQDRLRDVGMAVTDQARGLSGGESTGELSHVPHHLADLGSEEYLQDMNMLLAANEGQLADEVRDALLRLDQNTYGKCENCGRAITQERLNALPFARYCVKCAEELEETATADGQTNFNTGRPDGPADTLAPEGEMGESGPLGDVHAAGTAGGGTAIGGLAGSNRNRGEPDIDDLQDATGSSHPDAAERRVRRRGHDVQPIAYESDEDRKRYAEKARAVK
jgi:RNA polymerase-binding transcription factor DksA